MHATLPTPEETTQPTRYSPFRGQRLAPWLLALVPLLCMLGIALASLRHTGSLAFPIDDGYIYSNYVLGASQGHAFTYNLGEASGGITSLGWYILSTLTYFLLAPFHVFPGMAAFAPESIKGDMPTALQAGHLYLSSQIPGLLCLIATSLGTWRLADLVLPPSEKRPMSRGALCWLLGALTGADLGLTWGATSGLEVTLSSALVTWSLCLLISESRRDTLRWSLLLAGLLPWARPELIVVGISGLLWLVGRGIFSGTPRARKVAIKNAGFYLAAIVAGALTMSLIYFAGWGRPLPSSFYAKVGGLRFGSRFFSATDELLIAGRALPFIAGALALIGTVSVWIRARRTSGETGREARSSAVLLLLTSVLFLASIMVSLPWFGQEDRYLLPIHPVVIVQIGFLAWAIMRFISIENVLAARGVKPLAAFAFLALFSIFNYWWATQDFAVEVRNIADGHVAPALWLKANTPSESLVASEPIGAVKLFSGRRTIDLVGLTTPSTLGTYGNWPLAWRALRAANANYLLFYPAWFGRDGVPRWAVERARFTIPDNRIVGAPVIAIYELHWNLYTEP